MREVPGFPGYLVDDAGRVYSRRVFCGNGGWRADGEPRELKATIRSSGYAVVTLRLPIGTAVQRKVHQLVLEAFVGPRPVGHVTRHLDGIKSNNALGNLAWGTHAENEADKVRLGEVVTGDRHYMRRNPERARMNAQRLRANPPRGAQNGASKLDDARVAEMRRRRLDGWSLRALASVYGVSRPTVTSIVRGETWKHVS